MHSESEIKEIFDKTFNLSQADGTEILYQGSNRSLTRYANNQIHQNVAEVSQDISIRTIVGKKSGKISLNKTDPKSLQEAVERAIVMAQSQPDDPNLVPLPGSGRSIVVPDIQKDRQTQGRKYAFSARVH